MKTTTDAAAARSAAHSGRCRARSLQTISFRPVVAASAVACPSRRRTARRSIRRVVTPFVGFAETGCKPISPVLAGDSTSMIDVVPGDRLDGGRQVRRTSVVPPCRYRWRPAQFLPVQWGLGAPDDARRVAFGGGDVWLVAVRCEVSMNAACCRRLTECGGFPPNSATLTMSSVTINSSSTLPSFRHSFEAFERTAAAGERIRIPISPISAAQGTTGIRVDAGIRASSAHLVFRARAERSRQVWAVAPFGSVVVGWSRHARRIKYVRDGSVRR